MNKGIITFTMLAGLAIIGLIVFKVGQSFKTPEMPNAQIHPALPIHTENHVETPHELEDETFTIVEQMPEFPGGAAEMMKFISRNIQYPAIAKENNIEGRVVIGFVIDKNGFIRDPEIKRDIGAKCGEEALRVVRNMPQWTPGYQKGEAVNVHFNLPVRFKLE